MGWFDLHVHTRWSRDSLLDPREAAEAARRRGLAGIAITDHGEVLGCSEAMEVEGVAVIPGQEVRTAEGDLIVLMV
ncbi:MAG: metal-dependent phosphoesterase, partial [Thermoproteota archaeon]